MHCIVYVSKAIFRFHKTDLIALSKCSSEKNRYLGITGYLYYKSGHFLQYIEGDSTEVDVLYQNIAADPRHQILVSTQQTDNVHRRFSGWGMNIITDNLIKEVSLESILVDTLSITQMTGDLAESQHHPVWRQVDMIAKYQHLIPTYEC